MDSNQNISVRIRLVLSLLVLVYLGGLVIGFAYAFFGSRSDVGGGEQLAAIVYGVGMIASGVAGIVCAGRVEATGNLKRPIGCAVAAVICFLLAIAFGP